MLKGGGGPEATVSAVRSKMQSYGHGHPSMARSCASASISCLSCWFVRCLCCCCCLSCAGMSHPTPFLTLPDTQTVTGAVTGAVTSVGKGVTTVGKVRHAAVSLPPVANRQATQRTTSFLVVAAGGLAGLPLPCRCTWIFDNPISCATVNTVQVVLLTSTQWCAGLALPWGLLV